MLRDIGSSLILTVVFAQVLESVRFSLPGKPKLTSCRSPDKETFTCWWEPGSDGGLPTNYSLFYRKENSDTLYECPDYHTAGNNSCFFSKNVTAIWVSYNITVVATNDLGSSYSDPVEVDVVYIVQPHTPENVTLALENEDKPFLLVKWEPPGKADTRSGWITLVYQLRVKLENGDQWEEHFAGQQKQFNIFSLHSGEVYMVQVRCKPDHGFWSEWSTTAYIKVPDYITKERSMWVLLGFFCAVIFVILTCTLHMKRNSVKHFLLPPVPGPKIKGFDTQLLKSGKSEDVFSALVIQSFPPKSDYEDLLVEYLEVYDTEEQELVLDGKDLQDGRLKSKSSSDSDSGRGSCDSHTLLMEKCSERKEEQTTVLRDKGGENSKMPLTKSDSQVHKLDGPGPADGKSKSWPTVSNSHSHDQKTPYHSIPEMPRQCQEPVNHLSPNHSQDYWENPAEFYHRKPQIGHSHMQAYSEFNIKGIEQREASFPTSKSMEYVEVQRVNQENILILKPLVHDGQDLFHLEFTGQDYSKVNSVINDSVLLLQREMDSQCLNNCHERGIPAEIWPQPQLGKPATQPPAPLAQGGIHLAPNGYVDTATILPTY